MAVISKSDYDATGRHLSSAQDDPELLMECYKTRNVQNNSKQYTASKMQRDHASERL